MFAEYNRVNKLWKKYSKFTEKFRRYALTKGNQEKKEKRKKKRKIFSATAIILVQLST